MIDRVAHVTWRGRHWTEWSILIYYAGWVLLAASTPLLSPSHWVYAAMSALVGAWGIGAWAARWGADRGDSDCDPRGGHGRAGGAAAGLRGAGERHGRVSAAAGPGTLIRSRC